VSLSYLFNIKKKSDLESWKRNDFLCAVQIQNINPALGFCAFDKSNNLVWVNYIKFKREKFQNYKWRKTL